MTEVETAVREALAKMTPEQKQRAREYAARFWEGTTLAHHYRAGSMDRTSAVGATAFAVVAGDAREAALLAELDAARAEAARTTTLTKGKDNAVQNPGIPYQTQHGRNYFWQTCCERPQACLRPSQREAVSTSHNCEGREVHAGLPT